MIEYPKEKDRRKGGYPRPESDLYSKDAKKLIKTERREDELDRLREAQEQKRVWRRTVIFCGLLNATLIILALIGMGE